MSFCVQDFGYFLVYQNDFIDEDPRGHGDAFLCPVSDDLPSNSTVPSAMNEAQPIQASYGV